MTGRVALILPNLGGGGAERVNICLAKEFIERGLEVEFVLMCASGELLGLVPATSHIVDLKTRRIRNLIGPLTQYIRDKKPDAVLASMWPLTSMAIACTRLARVATRVLSWEHATLSQQYANRGAVHRQLLKSSVAVTYPLANARVAVSEGVANDLVRLSGIARSTITVISNPVPTPSVDGRQEDPGWGVPHGRRILSVGRLNAQKNQELLIRAFARMPQSDESRLILLGEGPLRGALGSIAHEQRVTDRVIMPGFIVDPSPYYGSADLFVLSSDSEGLPTVLVEALGWGLFVVSTDCPSGPAEILENGRYGSLVPVGDVDALATAMNEALNSAHDKDALRARAADFLPSRAADKFVHLLFPR